LWTTNQDGTQTAVLWGNQSVGPDHLAEPRSIPGSTRLMFTAVGHHDWFHGSIGMLDPRRGFNFPHGLTRVTFDLPWAEVGNSPADQCESPHYHASGRFSGYLGPYPLSEERESGHCGAAAEKAVFTPTDPNVARRQETYPKNAGMLLSSHVSVIKEPSDILATAIRWPRLLFPPGISTPNRRSVRWRGVECP